MRGFGPCGPTGGDPVCDPEEPFTEPNKQYNQTQRWWAKATAISDLSEEKSSRCVFTLFALSSSVASVKIVRTVKVRWTELVEDVSHILLMCTVTQNHSLTHSNRAPSLPQTPAKHSPPGDVHTKSYHTFFFLNIVKSNISPSCTRSSSQTMFGSFPLLMLPVDTVRGQRQRTLRVSCWKANRWYAFSLNSHFRTINLQHICLYTSRRTFIWSSRFSKKRVHCQEITVSFHRTHVSLASQAVSMGQCREEELTEEPWASTSFVKRYFAESWNSITTLF